MTTTENEDPREQIDRDFDRVGARARAHRDEILRIAGSLPESPADRRFAERARATIDDMLPVRRTDWRLVAAAAVVIGACAIGLALVETRGDDPRPPIELGTGSIEGLSPIGPRSAFDQFAWRLRRGTAARYALIVSTPEGRELFRESDLGQPHHRPTARQLELIQGAIRWRVLAMDAAGDVVDSASFDASR
ncbi:MAG: hypothetical protein IPH13_14625 [Planctomycetes bacterium]|nr:hypothetical protein [Planctomycetota bacterium]MCC7172072.1 hypothetical protein [Planctomycetota bacterium]